MVQHCRKAYSYIRFSTPEQRLGDSLRRQIAAAETWCKGEKLTLDSSLRDEGVSGYRRRNATQGALATFLAAIKAGDVTPGSVLIIESLDRLSRAEPLEAMDLLRDILKAGIEVVTLHDRQRYSSASMREIGPLLQALVIMSRAHEESHIKAQRLSESWVNKRGIAAAERRPMTRQTPAWIRVDGVRAIGSRNDWSNARFVLIPERAEIVVEIFERRAEGWGRRRIANELNHREVPVWGRGKRRARGGWQESYIAKILATRAVLGEYQPHRLENGRYSKRIPAGDPIPGYYPAAISEELWLAAHANDSEARSAKGRPSSSALLSGLLVDPAGAPMHVERKGGGCNYYVTARAFRRPDQPTHRWRIDHLGSAVLMVIREIDWARVFSRPTREPELRRLRAELAGCERDQVAIKAKLKAAAERLLDSDFADLRDELRTAASGLKTRQADIEQRSAAVHREITAIEAEERASWNGGSSIRASAEDLSNPTAFTRLRRELKALIKSITLYPDGNVASMSRSTVAEIRVHAESMLHGNQGLLAREQGRVCGAFKIEYANAQTLTVFVTYRPSARTRTEPVVLFADGVGYSVSDAGKAQRHVMAASRGQQAPSS